MALLGYPRGHRIDPETRYCMTVHERLMSSIWACGPPIDMKIRSSRRVYDQSCVDGKGRLHSG